jgi:[protein-PII] uridylyltransferase
MPAASRRDPIEGFLASMPPRYRELFDGDEVREHAAIVSRRGDSPIHMELWRRLPRGGAIACVVADDRPGLLSFISAALVVHGMDVEAAQAFMREGTGEAVDLFWLKRDLSDAGGAFAAPVLEADVARAGDLLRDLVIGKTTLDEVTARARARPTPPRETTTRVTFEGNTDGSVSVLTVETFDRPGLLLAVTRALYRARVQIIGSEAKTDGGRVVDRFSIVELDGAPLRPSRRGLLQVEVLSAIDALRHGLANE